VSAFDITNSNQTGAKLSDGADSNYQVTVSAAPPSDTTAPTGSITINGDLPYTSSTSVTLNLDATDNVGVTGYNVNNSGWVTFAAITPYSADIPWTLPVGDGIKTVSVQYRDAAGNPSAVYMDSISLDTSGPVIVPTVSPLPNGAGWNNSTPVTVSWSVTDPESGIVSSLGDETTELTEETAGITLTCSATNGAGLYNEVSVTVMIDKTSPTLTWDAIDPTPNAAGWNNTTATIAFETDDNLSGVASATSPSPLSFNSEAENQTQDVTVTDVAGNSATFASPAVSIDWTPPVVTITLPDTGHGIGVYIFGEVVSATWTATDNLSGVVPPDHGTLPINTSSLGAQSLVVPAALAIDYAGNPSLADSTTYKYSVKYGFNGLLPPYQAPPRAYKITSSIPLKWQYTDAGGNVVDSPAANPSVQIKMVSEGGSEGDAITLTDPGSSGLRYDTLTMTWQYNWQTKGLAAGTYNIRITSTQTGQTDGPFEILLRK